MQKLGPVQQKIILLFLAAATLSISGSKSAFPRILKATRKEWRKVDQRSFNRSLRSLHRQKLLEAIKHKNGSIALKLTPDGRMRAGFFQLFGGAIRIKRQKVWDGLWRIVMFDVPEKKRIFRDILRDHLKAIGFKELQHSVFIFPYPCEKEMQSLVRLYDAALYVRIVTAKTIDNEQEMRQCFFAKNHKK